LVYNGNTMSSRDVDTSNRVVDINSLSNDFSNTGASGTGTLGGGSSAGGAGLDSISLSNTGVLTTGGVGGDGTYSRVTVDAKGRVTAGSTGFSAAYTSTSANLTLNSTHYAVEATAAVTITLATPTTAANKGRVHKIRNSSSGVVSITTSSATTNGVAGSTTYSLPVGETIGLVCTGSVWIAIQDPTIAGAWTVSGTAISSSNKIVDQGNTVSGTAISTTNPVVDGASIRRKAPGIMVPPVAEITNTLTFTTGTNVVRMTRFIPTDSITVNYLGAAPAVATTTNQYTNLHLGIYSIASTSSNPSLLCYATNPGNDNLGRSGWYQEDLSTLAVQTNSLSQSATVGTIGGSSGAWTTTLTGMTSTIGYYIGAVLAITTGTGTLPGTVTVTSIPSSTSITTSSTGSTSPTAGTISTQIASTNGSAGGLLTNNTNVFKPVNTPVTLTAGNVYWAAAGSYAGNAWSSATAYAVGDYAISGGLTYCCISAHTNQTPAISSTYWATLNPAQIHCATGPINANVYRMFSSTTGTNAYLYNESVNVANTVASTYFSSGQLATWSTSASGNFGSSANRPLVCLRTS
jgi:hypothetical protein